MTTTYAGPPTFGAARRDATGEPIIFHVEGEAEPFTIPRPLPAFPLLDMAAEAMDGNEAGALGGFLRFLRGCIPEGEWHRFRDAVTRERWEASDLLPLVQYLVQEATGRPTTPLSGSRGWSDSGMTWQNQGPSESGGGHPSR